MNRSSILTSLRNRAAARGKEDEDEEEKERKEKARMGGRKRVGTKGLTISAYITAAARGREGPGEGPVLATCYYIRGPKYACITHTHIYTGLSTPWKHVRPVAGLIRTRPDRERRWEARHLYDETRFTTRVSLSFLSYAARPRIVPYRTRDYPRIVPIDRYSRTPTLK